MKYPLSVNSVAVCLTFLLIPVLQAQEDETPAPETPAVAEASDEAKNAMQVFQLPDGITATVFAAEPKVANPVAIDVDTQNRVWVCESYRQEKGIEDNRNHPEWLHDDLAAQTVADRLAYIHKHLGDEAIKYTRQDDRIRVLIDTDMDGVADQSTIFADRFNAIEEGTGAGVLNYRGEVYYTCIPKLWKLLDEDQDGVADRRVSLHDGFGVRFAFRGHDLHGLIVGPDGRLYFSIGDRGYHVNDEVSDPASGAVFRCNLDGSSLEVVHAGLRNPQELAFDNYGNLFTGDNNSDSGDQARMVYVVEGGDSGWRMHYQYLPDRGPFNRERIWHGYPNYTSAAYVLPPIDNFADGPSGFAFYPGTGFSDHLNDRFLLCDFRGQTSGSGIKTFRLKPRGAFFEIADEENTFWNVLATDCCFGPDGRLYVSDWVHGWDGLGKGRVYAFRDENADHELVRKTRSLLQSDWGEVPTNSLATLTGFPDRRVRQEAQFELVRRKDLRTIEQLVNRVRKIEGDSQLSRIHGLWALEQICRDDAENQGAEELFAELLVGLMHDREPELRAQAAKLSGDFFRSSPRPFEGATQLVLEQLLKDESHRVRYFAAISLGKFADQKFVSPVLDLIQENANQDPLIRHAGIMALVYHTRKHDDSLLSLAINHGSHVVRLAATVACRKLEQSGYSTTSLLKQALSDADASVVVEAARAIHDLPVPALLPDLASLDTTNGEHDELDRRIMNANYRLGHRDSLNRINRLIAGELLTLDRRMDAVRMLSTWNQPPNLDWVLGSWRPVDQSGRVGNAADVVENLFESFEKYPPELGATLVEAATDLKVRSALPVLMKIFNEDQNADHRLKALQGILAFGGEGVPEVVSRAMDSDEPNLRMAALSHVAKSDFGSIVDQLSTAIDSGSTAERQNAISIIGQSEHPSAKKLLLDLLARFQQLNPDSQLDVFQAGQASRDSAIKEATADLVAKSEAANPLFKYRLALSGGDEAAGSRIFYERTDVSCLRCHKIQGSGGDVGPNLSDIALNRDREYLLESLIEPNKTITENFETVVVLDIDGKVHVGVTKSSTDEVLSIMTADAIMVNIPQDDIEEIRRGESAMPNDVTKHLTLAELRDLIEFLAKQNRRDESIEESD